MYVCMYPLCIINLCVHLLFRSSIGTIEHFSCQYYNIPAVNVYSIPCGIHTVSIQYPMTYIIRYYCPRLPI